MPQTGGGRRWPRIPHSACEQKCGGLHIRTHAEYPFVTLGTLTLQHPTYFGVHFVSRQGNMFLQPIKAVEIRSCTFMFGNA